MKIAVDIDDTLNILDRVTRAKGYIERMGLPYTLLDPDAHTLIEVFDWGVEEVAKFLREGGVSTFTEADARPFAKEVLTKWRKLGHEVIILTARPKEYFINPVNVSRDWLQKRKIPYDSIVAECTEKGKYCAEHGISMLVDDSLKHCRSAQNHGVYAILLVSKFTQAQAGEIRFSSETWKGVERLADQIFRTLELETLASTACSAERVEVCDGWEIRQDSKEAFRANGIRPIAPSQHPYGYKIAEIEEKFLATGAPCRFVLTAIDGVLDEFLRNHGYALERSCFMMGKEGLPEGTGASEVRVSRFPDTEWLTAFVAVSGGAPTRNFLRAQGKQLYLTAYENGKPVSVVSGVIYGDWLGVYDVHTAENSRRKGYAHSLVLRLCREAEKLGACRAFLHVVAGNRPAEALYNSLGFSRCYEYWFRRKWELEEV